MVAEHKCNKLSEKKSDLEDVNPEDPDVISDILEEAKVNSKIKDNMCCLNITSVLVFI